MTHSNRTRDRVRRAGDHLDATASRRGFLALAGASVVGAGFAGPASAASAAPSASSTQSGVPSAVGTELVAEGFTAPVGVEFPPGSDRGYVVDQAGLLHVIGPDGRVDEPFLDLRDRMVTLDGGYSERGLLGLAFHPDFAENGRFFVRYSAPRRSGTPSDYSHTFVLAEFTASGDPPAADPGSERTVLEIPQPQANHNAGAIAFGPDGYLYVAVGDGGLARDQGTGHVQDWYDGVGGGNGQDVTENLLGSILRLDVDAESDGKPYAIPEDNPLVDREGLDEQYAWGFRNPWRFSFDGDRLFVADVGQDRYEEVNVVEAGGNYGWNVREGAHCYEADDCPSTATEQPPYDGQPLRDPVAEYPHAGDDPSGLAVIGGFVYRGEAIRDLRGRYVFADWQTGGDLFVATETDDGGRWPIETVTMTAMDERPPGAMALAFGRDDDEHLYVCTTNESGVSGGSGAVHRLVSVDEGETTRRVDDSTATDDDSAPGDDPGAGGGSGETGGDDGTTTSGQPGFGGLAGVLGLGGAAGYLLARRGD